MRGGKDNMTEPTTPITQTTEHPDRYARNDPESFAAGEETTPEKDAEERQEHVGTFAAGEETTPARMPRSGSTPGRSATRSRPPDPNSHRPGAGSLHLRSTAARNEPPSIVFGARSPRRARTAVGPSRPCP